MSKLSLTAVDNESCFVYGRINPAEQRERAHSALLHWIVYIQSQRHTPPKSKQKVKGQVWRALLHYAVILIKFNSLYSLTHFIIECVRSIWDWWMLLCQGNNPSGAVLNNDQHIWLMSAGSSGWGEGFPFVSLPLCGLWWELSICRYDDDWYH